MNLNRLLLATLLLLSGTVHAGTIVYTTFGASYNYENNISGALGNYADEFSPSSSGPLSQIVMALGPSELSTPPNPAAMTIYADNSGTPGAILEQIAVDAGPFHNPGIDPSGILVTGLSVTHPFLTAGQKYWVGASVLPGEQINWYEGMDGYQPGMVGEFFGGSWVLESPQHTSAFTAEITVSDPAPEPAVFGTIGVSLIGLAMGYRFRSRRLSQLPSPSQPPSTRSVSPLTKPLSAGSARNAMA